MKLLLIREASTAKSTPGTLYVDSQFFAYTLEDVVREQWVNGKLVNPANWKLQNQTAIPSGSYKVIADYSPHFQKLLPHVLAVPGFDGIRIHGGNTSADTEGCILIAAHRQEPDRIYDCAERMNSFTQALVAAKTADLVIEPYEAEQLRAHGLGIQL